MPGSHAPPPLPPHPIWSDVHVERLLGAKRGENPWICPFCWHLSTSTEQTCHRRYFVFGVTTPNNSSCTNGAVAQLISYVIVRWTNTNIIAVSLIVMRRFYHVKSSTAVSYSTYHTVFPVFILTTIVLNLTEYQYARSSAAVETCGIQSYGGGDEEVRSAIMI